MSVSNQDKPNVLSEEEGFLQRWSRRKHETEQTPAVQTETMPTSVVGVEQNLLTDADMPAIDSLTEDSDYSGFFSPRVSETLRRQALRKLFHAPMFNIRDGLDDYDGVYTEFEKLGDIVTADMRHQMEMEAEHQAEQMLDHNADQNETQPEMVAATPIEDELKTNQAGQAESETELTFDDVDDAEVES